MKNRKTLLFVLGGILLVILVLLVALLPRQSDRSIRIKTALSPDRIVSRVELTSGVLHFKTETEVYGELSREEKDALRPKPGDYAPEYERGFTVKDEDIMRLLNIEPEKWRIPDRLAFQYELFDVTIGLIRGEAPEEVYSDDVLYTRRYDDGSGFAAIEVALPGRRWIRGAELNGLSAQHVKAVYGSLDSRIGDMPLSVLNCEYSPWDRDLEACFIAGNAAYFIRSNAMTQQEFIELLISIYEAPRPVTEDAIRSLEAAAVTGQETEVRSATIAYFDEPCGLSQEWQVSEHVVLDRKHAQSTAEIQGLKGIIDGIDSWSDGLPGGGELLIDGHLGLSDDERIYYFSYGSKLLCYAVLSLDQETETVLPEWHYAQLSDADLELIKSIRDSEDGIHY